MALMVIGVGFPSVIPLTNEIIVREELVGQ
jgi:hypothetical protein